MRSLSFAIGDLRLRLRLSSPRAYLQGGVAIQEPSLNANGSGAICSDTTSLNMSGDERQTGYTIGARVDIHTKDRFSIGIGYQYFRFKSDLDLTATGRVNNQSESGSGAIGATTRIHALRVGGNLKP